ncbi:MAG: Eco57I restriction-modification methylase domain-containing protein [Deltaproteobacteria bacterium]|nr:Eco57I restriction-modification methylase domain-containing protein [Deltaproteobacteria bacterium]
MSGLPPTFEPTREARRAPAPPAPIRPGHRSSAEAGEAAWTAFLAEARAALQASGHQNGKNGKDVAERFAASLAARFGASPGSARRNRRARAVPAEDDRHVRVWLGGWIFVRHDASADPAARRLGPEAMARFHEAFAGGLGCVYTALGEVRFMARRALLEHLAGPHPALPALPRAKAAALLGAHPEKIAALAARLSLAERRGAAARLRALRLLDPGCGAGAFLVGCLEELVRLGTALGMGAPGAIAAQAVTENLFGVDVDPGAVEVTRGRLALAAPGATPNLAAGDALALRWLHEFPRLFEAGAVRGSTGPGATGEGSFDVVIGNPPYVRQELIRSHELPAALRRRARALGLSQRADLYVYFFLEGLRLLRPGGTLALLTSHAWLDLDYGAALRTILLEQADLSLIESDHRSFRGASVNTVVTLARRRAPGNGSSTKAAPGDGAPVRFATLRVPFARAAEGPLFRALDGRREVETPALRLRLAARDALLPAAPRDPVPRWGGLWLRGPAVIFRARAASAGRTVALGEIAEVVFGLKTGCNAFFHLEDEGPADGDDGKGANGLRRVRSRLDGRSHVIETAYLRPIVTTLKEVSGLAVARDTLRRRVLVIPPGAELAGARVADYLRAGERHGVHRLASVASRAPWYALAPPRGDFLIPRRIGARMPVARAGGVAFDNNLFGITPRAGVPPDALHAVLNATITRLCVELEGRDLTGAQAVVDTNVYLVKAVPVPRLDLIRVQAEPLSRLVRALALRPSRSIFDERGARDRNALDALVLSLWGLPAREVNAVQEAVAGLVARRLAKAAGGAAEQASAGPGF